VRGSRLYRAGGARASGPEATRARGMSSGSDSESDPSTARGGG
jgi:hypothetical protein